MARQDRKAHRQTHHTGTVKVAVTRTAGGGQAAAPVRWVVGLVWWQGRCPPWGPPNISSSRPPELAVASVTGSRPAAAEQGR